ncbi:MAG: RNA 2',3'-cyclic phosphodiesterase [Thermodesulfobacteriota bacterium]
MTASVTDEMRSFVAVELDEAARSFLAATIGKLRPVGTEVKWVRPEGIHLTLKFLGNVKTAALPEITHALEQAMAGRKAFEIGIQSVGAFPSLSRPRVFWAGVVDPAAALGPLAAAVEDALEPLGFPREPRPFRPHLTLGRVRSDRRPPTELAITVATMRDLKGPSFHARDAVLFQSILQPSGAQYVALSRFKFL